MKRRLLLACLMVFCATTLLSSAKKEPTLAELKARADSASLHDQPHLCLDVAKRQLDTATKQFDSGNADAAQSAVQDVATYGHKAAEAAIQSRKHMKKTEISLREIVLKLRDLRRGVEFDDRPPIEAAIGNLEKMRTQLLKKMFSKD